VPAATRSAAGTTTLGGTPDGAQVTAEQGGLDPDIDYELIGFDSQKLVRFWSQRQASLGCRRTLIIERFDRTWRCPKTPKFVAPCRTSGGLLAQTVQTAGCTGVCDRA
jgi:hypothetical protein